MNEIQNLKPIFILGNNRSGTSLLRLMLHLHSNICIPPESHFFLWLEEEYGNWNNTKLESYIEDLFEATKFETWGIDKNELSEFLKKIKIKNYAHLTSLIYVFYAIQDNLQSVRFWGDKNSLWTNKLQTILEYFPNAYFIHLVRDGRDVACSYRYLNKQNLKSRYAPKLANNISDIAKIWQNNVTTVDTFLSAKVKSSNKITLTFENLLINPHLEITKILQKLDLKLEKSQLSYFLKRKESIEPKEFFKWKEKLQEPPDLKNIGKFKNELTYDEITQFNFIAKEALTKFNYL